MRTLKSFGELSEVKSYFGLAETNIPNVRGVSTKETFRDVQAIHMTEQELSRWLQRQGRVNWSKYR